MRPRASGQTTMKIQNVTDMISDHPPVAAQSNLRGRSKVNTTHNKRTGRQQTYIRGCSKQPARKVEGQHTHNKRTGRQQTHSNLSDHPPVAAQSNLQGRSKVNTHINYSVGLFSSMPLCEYEMCLASAVSAGSSCECARFGRARCLTLRYSLLLCVG